MSVPGKEIDVEAVAKFVEINGEPWVMPIVVLDDPEFTHVGVLSAVAQATTTFLYEAEKNPEIQVLINEWENTNQIRKIARRAKKNHWDKAIEARSNFVSENKKGKVAVFAPHPANETPPEINRLQLSGFKSQERGTQRFKKYLPTIFISPYTNLSLGKTCAQVSHAAHFLYRQASAEQKNQWRVRGEFKCNIEFIEARFWDILVSDYTPDAEVRDGGYTEIPQGTRTAVAFWEDPLSINFSELSLTKWLA